LLKLKNKTLFFIFDNDRINNKKIFKRFFSLIVLKNPKLKNFKKLFFKKKENNIKLKNLSLLLKFLEKNSKLLLFNKENILLKNFKENL
jgi:hypothetical protein